MVEYRELEVELARVRNFYTKKLEALQRKHQGQVSALRRGGGGGGGGSLGGGEGGEETNPHHEREKQELRGRISLLEAEVMRSAEELGRMRASALSAANTAASFNTVPAPATATAPTTHFHSQSPSRNRDQNQQQQQVKELEKKREDEEEEEIRELREDNAQYRSQVKRLEREIRNQDKKLAQLMTEVNRDSDSDDDNHVRKNNSPVRKSLPVTSSLPVDTTTEHLQKELSDQADTMMAMSADWSTMKGELQRTIQTLKQNKTDLQTQIAELQQSVFDKGGEVQHWQGQALKLEMITQQAKTPQMQQFLV